MDLTKRLAELDRLKRQLDTLRPLDPVQVRNLSKLYQAAEVEYIYESNAIEGNSLTLRETAMVLA